MVQYCCCHQRYCAQASRVIAAGGDEFAIYKGMFAVPMEQKENGKKSKFGGDSEKRRTFQRERWLAYLPIDEWTEKKPRVSRIHFTRDALNKIDAHSKSMRGACMRQSRFFREGSDATSPSEDIWPTEDASETLWVPDVARDVIEERFSLTASCPSSPMATPIKNKTAISVDEGNINNKENKATRETVSTTKSAARVTKRTRNDEEEDQESIITRVVKRQARRPRVATHLESNNVLATKSMVDQIDAHAYLVGMAQQRRKPPSFQCMQPAGYPAMSSVFGSAQSNLFDASGKMECAILLLRLCHSGV